jgi:hypothetical protein
MPAMAVIRASRKCMTVSNLSVCFSFTFCMFSRIMVTLVIFISRSRTLLSSSAEYRSSRMMFRGRRTEREP